MKRITVIGFGSWGIALGLLLDKNGHKITAWDNEAYVTKLLKTRKNEYLPEIVIPESITITHDITTATESAEVFVFASTSKGVGITAPKFAPFFTSDKIITICAKGLEETRQIRLSQYLQELCNSQVATLTGPSHAEEVLKNIPTAVVAAAEDEKTAEAVQSIFSADSFRVYTSSDIIGAEIGGALKNVIALAAGCSDGLGFGDNTKAALITRGIAEITRLGVAMGAKEKTFSGLSGIGDLIVTCTSQHSRNWRAGYSLAQGKTLNETLTAIGMAVEGVDTAKTALQLAHNHKITMPIIEEINKVLFQNKSPREAVSDLMQRELREEK
ncbi:MAG: NAD(P)-dependent glycerol-3-phosphate dehydrogenase [Defluviitaleaceae bacterium]|nr:NAD(P)-dependent glycerol-3-phosphate dehydrogenase [Defluviitaleaceae bacterium]